MNVACLHIHSPVSECLCVQICIHCRLEFIFGCLCAMEKREHVHLYVNEKEGAKSCLCILMCVC